VTAPLAPWQVWWTDFDPVEGQEQAGRRPAVVVSSRFHLTLTGGGLVSVLPLTTRERPGWLHRVRIGAGGKPVSYAITEQVRTVSRSRLTGRAPVWTLTSEQVNEVRTILSRMLDL
jgi:mRNA interferase MazF